MKKKIAVVGVVLSVSLAALSGCGFMDLGKADENFPYDIAVEQGYTADEGSWLAENTPESTIYRKLWEEARADGSFTGTYMDFLKELNFGDDSAYLQQSLLSAVSVVAAMDASTVSAGAGVILELDSSTGDLDVITNYHVIYSSTRHGISNDISIYLYGGDFAAGELSATYVGGSAAEDIALLHVDGDATVREGTSASSATHTNREVVAASAACPAKVGDSDSLLVGDSVYAIGNPEMEGISVVSGVVSVDAESVTMDAIDGSGQVDMLELRTDATVNHGNSGGGLFNRAGELVGIVNARSEADDVYGFGYAIPINHALAVADNLRANGGVLKHARLGITIRTENGHSAYDPLSGRTIISEKLVVNAVNSGSAAASAGMDVGDTFVSLTLNGKTVQATRNFKITNLLLEIRKGDTLTVVVSRDGKSVTLTVAFNQDRYFETR